MDFQVMQIILGKAAKLPFVKRLDSPSWCDGWVVKGQRKTKCDRPAEWVYRAGKTKKPHSKSKWCCDYHLITTMRSTKYDEARCERAWAKIEKEAS